jgi:hypothetical protein
MRAMTMMVLCSTLPAVGCGSGELDYSDRDGDGANTDGTDGADDGDGIAIAGTWIDSFGITNTITDDAWGWTYPGYPDYDFDIVDYDNDDGLAIVHDAFETKGEKLWGRFEWTFVGDVPYYCQTADGLASEEAATEMEPIDHDDVTANCHGFAWFEMMPV